MQGAVGPADELGLLTVGLCSVFNGCFQLARYTDRLGLCSSAAAAHRDLAQPGHISFIYQSMEWQIRLDDFLLYDWFVQKKASRWSHGQLLILHIDLLNKPSHATSHLGS